MKEYTYYFADVGVGIFLADPRGTDDPSYPGLGSCLLQVGDTIILCISEVDCSGVPKDNDENTQRIALDASAYQTDADIRVELHDLIIEEGELLYISEWLQNMQIFVLDEVPEDYFLDCGRNTLTAEDIAELIQYIDS